MVDEEVSLQGEDRDFQARCAPPRSARGEGLPRTFREQAVVDDVLNSVPGNKVGHHVHHPQLPIRDPGGLEEEFFVDPKWGQ